jgi:ketosteroid isomerase-like protein
VVSQEHVEIVRRVAEAWQRDDFEGFLCLLDPEIEWLTGTERGMGSTAYHGHEGVRELWNHWRTEFDDIWVETGQVRDLGGERVLRLAHIRFRGPASGIVVESQLALVQTLRDGKIVRSMDYLSHEEALKAVGLSE